jgi:hypothetical protein
VGYNVYITRRKAWSDDRGPSISTQEWEAYCTTDPDLASLVCDRGNVEAKNPERALLLKMVSVAPHLGASVQGDDGEVYDAEGNALHPRVGLVSRIASWVRNHVSSGATPISASSLPFKVGDRVRDSRGYVASVTEIDVRAEHGLGRITVKYDDGRTLSSTAIAHGLERADA